jgi:nicotinate-nucleotide pyrophosphorylase (carboxylating)
MRPRVNKEFQQIAWDESLASDWQKILDLGVQEDFGTLGDWTTAALVPEHVPGQAAVVVRRPGVIAGLPAVAATLHAVSPVLEWIPAWSDGQATRAGQSLGLIRGPAAEILKAERLVLNLLGRLSGIATLTRRYVEAVAGTRAKIYDTRKTTPGWRRLEKYAVRCGGGHNHRTGLYEAVLIKDNHLAVGASSGSSRYTPAESVERARQYLRGHLPAKEAAAMIVEVEVDTLEQLAQVLPAAPDIVLLDNMTPSLTRQAVAQRDAAFPNVELESSGGVNLDTLRALAETGVDRISVGALTHSAASLDIGLDWSA